MDRQTLGAKRRCRRFARLSCIALAALAGLSQATSVSARPMGWGTQQVAFESFRDGNAEIYVMAPDGSDQRNVTQDPAADADPAWAPAVNSLDCGNTTNPSPAALAFDSTRAGAQPDIYVVSVAAGSSSTPVDLTNDSLARDTVPAWSPRGFMAADRLFIAYAHDAGGTRDIWVMRQDGSGKVNITNSPGVDENNPDWSPDGRDIVYDSDRDGVRQIWMTPVQLVAGDVQSGAPVRLTTGQQVKEDPSWVRFYKDYDDPGTPTPPLVYRSSDRIAYAVGPVDPDGVGYLDVIADVRTDPSAGGFSDPATFSTWGLTGDPGDDAAPVWSPTGTTLLHQRRDADGYWHIAVIPSSAGFFDPTPLSQVSTPLTAGRYSDVRPDWRAFIDCADMQPSPPRPLPQPRTRRRPHPSPSPSPGTPPSPAPGPAGRQKLSASLGRLSVAHRGRRRTIVAPIRSNAPVKVKAALAHGRRVIARHTWRLRAGRTVLHLKIPARAPHGVYRLTLRLTSAAGRTTLTSRVRL